MFIPRLSENSPTVMLNNPLWYGQNPFYQAGYGLPNCTCYAWGRAWEIMGGITRPAPTLPTGDAGTWFGSVTGYKTGQKPELGAILCLSEPGASGHVAVVEQIMPGKIIISESGYQSWYFHTETVNFQNGGYIPNWATGYNFQGFIYILNFHGKMWLYAKRRPIIRIYGKGE